jgi:hypothetical protein
MLLGTTQFFCGTSSLIVEGTSFTEESESRSLTMDINSNSNSNINNDQHQLRRNVKGETIRSISAGQGIIKNWMKEVLHRFLYTITKEGSARDDAAATTLQPPLYEGNKEPIFSSLSSEKRDEEQEASESTLVKKESSETKAEFEYDVHLDEEENELNESEFKEGGEEEKDLDNSTRENLRNLKSGKKGKRYGYGGRRGRYNYNYNNYYRPPPRRRRPPRYYGYGYNIYNSQNVVYATSNIRQPAAAFNPPANSNGIVLGDRTFILLDGSAPTTPRPSRPPTPTNAPTPRPSQTPTQRPTPRPSQNPTSRPTRNPTRSPTPR